MMNESSVIEGSKILITGAAGLIGPYILEEILTRNPEKVVLVDNLIRGRKANIQEYLNDERVFWVEGDILNAPLLADCIQGIDYVFHLAGLRLTRCSENPEEAIEVMVRGMNDLIQQAADAGVKKIIYSSSASVYGMASTFPTPETEAPAANRTVYGACKYFGEQLLRSYYHSIKMDYVALRYFNVYGPKMDHRGRYTEVLIKWLDCIREGRPPKIFGDGSTSADFVFVTDVARANILALESGCSDEVFNVGTGTETSLFQLLQLLLKSSRSRLEPVFLSADQVNPVRRRMADVSKAKAMLGFEAKVQLSEGLKKLTDWYVSLGKA